MLSIFSAPKEREGPADLGATATLESETQLDRDARALFEKSRKINEVCVNMHV